MTEGSPLDDLRARMLVEEMEEQTRLAAMAPPGFVAVVLMPVEVFGTDDCCEHGDTAVNPGPPVCEAGGYGLMDADDIGSDCNRARGRIYRVEREWGQRNRTEGQTCVVFIREEDVPFLDKRFGTPD